MDKSQSLTNQRVTRSSSSTLPRLCGSLRRKVHADHHRPPRRAIPSLRNDPAHVAVVVTFGGLLNAPSHDQIGAPFHSSSRDIVRSTDCTPFVASPDQSLNDAFFAVDDGICDDTFDTGAAVVLGSVVGNVSITSFVASFTPPSSSLPPGG